MKRYNKIVGFVKKCLIILIIVLLDYEWSGVFVFRDVGVSGGVGDTEKK